MLTERDTRLDYASLLFHGYRFRSPAPPGECGVPPSTDGEVRQE
jgi:hypothetical protein